MNKGRHKVNKYMQRLKNKLNLASFVAIISIVIKKRKKNLQWNGERAGCIMNKHITN
jgi:inosine/xanthosine triphosphate pyrophosphatase family protein